MEIRHLFISPAHNYVGHFGGPAGTHPIVEVDEVECVAGSGIRGDRYFDYKPDFKGQITFFEIETHERLCDEFAVFDKGPDVYRRNVFVEGRDLALYLEHAVDDQTRGHHQAVLLEIPEVAELLEVVLDAELLRSPSGKLGELPRQCSTAVPRGSALAAWTLSTT